MRNELDDIASQLEVMARGKVIYITHIIDESHYLYQG